MELNVAPIFEWAHWWKSDSKFLWIKDSFQDSKNIDIRTNPMSITLNKALKLDFSVNDLITKFIPLSNGIILAFGDTWNIYQKINWTWSKSSNSIWSKVLDAIEFDWYVFVSTPSNLYRQQLSNINSNTSFTQYQSLQTCDYHPLFNAYDAYLYIWDKDQLNTYESWVDLYTTKILTISPTFFIKFLYDLWWKIKLYIENTFKDETNILFFDWQNNIIQETIPYKHTIIDQIANKQGMDYIVSKDQLWVLTWYRQISYMHQYKYPNDINYTHHYSSNINSTTSNWTRVYLWGTGGVYEWGALNKNYPESLSYSYEVSWWSQSDIWAIEYIDWKLYVGWKNGTNYWIDILSDSYYTNWYLVSRVFFWNSKWAIKESQFIQSTFKALQWNENIKIYYRYNMDPTWNLLTTYDVNSYLENNLNTHTSLEWEFNFIEFKIELNWDWTSTPEFFELLLWYNHIKQW